MDQDVLPEPIMPKTNDTALSAEHFECSPEDVNWGDVGTLEHYRARLREITDMAFREGEYAG